MSKKIKEQDYYPDEVLEAGPVEKFIFDNFDKTFAIQYLYKPPEQIEKMEENPWNFGDSLRLDPDIHYLYFNDTVLWNELYWDLRHAVGFAWKCSDCIEAWRGDNSKLLVAETDAQKLLFWCMEQDYTLEDLYEMIRTKEIIKKL